MLAARATLSIGSYFVPLVFNDEYSPYGYIPVALKFDPNENVQSGAQGKNPLACHFVVGKLCSRCFYRRIVKLATVDITAHKVKNYPSIAFRNWKSP